MLKPENRSQKVLNLQLDSVLGQKAETLIKVEALLLPHVDTPIDIIVLPENALTGYLFKDPEAIFPMAESQSGWTFQQMSSIAKRFNAYVVCGYCEKDPIPGIASEENYDEADVKNWILYNSAMLIDRQGNFQHNYRKTFRFTPDIRYYTKGPGFSTTFIKNLSGTELKISIAICMDINPDEEASSEFNTFELSTYLTEQYVDYLILICAWNDGTPEVENDADVTMWYWMIRLLSQSEDMDIPDMDPQPRLKGKRVGVVVSDRVGKEEDTVFTGTSCAFLFNPIEIVGMMGKREEAALVYEMNI